MVVTTNIIGDMVGEVIGEEADLEVIMPVGSDPHDFEPSARQAEAMEEADLLVVNGAGFEEGLLGLIESAEESGTPVFAFADEVELLEFTGEHAGEEEEGTEDPHIWTDPARMITPVEAVAARLGELEGVDAEVIDSQATEYVGELESLDGDIETMVAEIPHERRVLVTNHEVFAYFADRYGFEVVGAVVPSLSTNAEASAGELTELAELIDTEGVPAIFAETTQSTQLADALADEAGGDVEVVELFSESLGESGSGAETYLDMMRTNAERIVEALA